MVDVMMVKPPAKTPETPMPATALPMMRKLDHGATAHMRDPISKMLKKAMKVHLRLNCVYSFPTSGWTTALKQR